MGFWNDVRNEWKTTFTDKKKRREFIIAMIAIGIANIVNECFIRPHYGLSFLKGAFVLFLLIIVAEILLTFAWLLIHKLTK